MAEDALSTSYEWVRWLSGVDATTLLLTLCQHIDDPGVTKDALVTLVHQWRANALEALLTVGKPLWTSISKSLLMPGCIC